MKLDRDANALLRYMSEFEYVPCGTVDLGRVLLFGSVYSDKKIARKLIGHGLVEQMDMDTCTNASMMVYAITRKGHNYLKGKEGI